MYIRFKKEKAIPLNKKYSPFVRKMKIIRDYFFIDKKFNKIRTTHFWEENRSFTAIKRIKLIQKHKLEYLIK